MGKPYADDLRLVVIRLIEEGHTRPEVAELCGISVSSVGRYIRRYRTTGSVSPDKFGGYKDQQPDVMLPARQKDCYRSQNAVETDSRGDRPC